MKLKFFLLAFCISVSAFSQEKEADTIKPERKFELKLDTYSRYIWRGQSWGGDFAAVQPTITYKGIPKLELELWATTNFRKEYAYPDESNKGYQEVDFSVSYLFKKYLSLKVSDYYWPSVEKVDDVDNGFFNYGRDGVKTVDVSFNLDRTEGDYDYPFMATISVLVAGNDFRDRNTNNPKQNFTTYAELGYMFTFFKKSETNIYVLPVIGAVFNNKAGYYANADFDKVSLCNMGVEVSKEFEFGDNGFVMPVSLNFIHNAADKNTEAFGRNFLVAGLSFKY